MLKQLLTAASLALLLAGAAHAADDPRRGKAALARAEREVPRETGKQETPRKAPPPVVRPVRADPVDSSRRHAGGPERGRERHGGDPRGDDRGHRDEVRPIRDARDDVRPARDARGDIRPTRDARDDVRPTWDARDADVRRNDHDDRGRSHGGSWRDDDRHRDLRDRDWRRDDEWRRRGWVYHGGRNDGWRYYRGHDHRAWRCVPPYRYTFDFGYRWGYELAWRDWLAFGRFDRYWRRPGYGYGGGYGYSAGYDAGWQDAAYYYTRGYRPDYWAYDPQGGWYFSFRISG
jgi:hypothetical protein